jgi:hypothetical protein
MAGGEAKIKIKVGDVEIDYEGDAEFLKDGLLAVCQELSKLNEHIPAPRTPKSHKAREDHGAEKPVGNHSTVTIATVLGAETGLELVIVAAAYLHFSEGKTEFTRAQILDAMKTATGYWQENYSNNLSTSALLGQLLVSKYCGHTPPYRQSQIFARHGVNLPRSTLGFSAILWGSNPLDRPGTGQGGRGARSCATAETPVTQTNRVF